jgi:hypothetical protein
MKNKIKLEEYVDDIVQDLPHSKYTARFREELLEHSEDSAKELGKKNETDISEKVMQKIGNRKLLIKNYKYFHNHYCYNLWPLEFLIYIPLSMIVFIMIFSIATLCAINSAIWYVKVLNFIFSAAISLGVSYVFFNIVFWRLAPHIKSKRSKIAAVMPLVIFPAFYSILILTSLIAKSIFSGDNFSYLELSAIFTYFLAVCIAFELIPLRQRKILSLPQASYLFLVGFWAILAASIFASCQNIGVLDKSWPSLGAIIPPPLTL